MLSCVLRTRFDFANRNARHDVYQLQTRVISNKPPHHAFDCWRVHPLLGSHQARREVCKAPYSVSDVFFVVICVILLDVELYWCIAGIVLLVAQ
jgi:hypothetical protein